MADILFNKFYRIYYSYKYIKINGKMSTVNGDSIMNVIPMKFITDEMVTKYFNYQIDIPYHNDECLSELINNLIKKSKDEKITRTLKYWKEKLEI
jgi:hypothetical protein